MDFKTLARSQKLFCVSKTFYGVFQVAGLEDIYHFKIDDDESFESIENGEKLLYYSQNPYLNKTMSLGTEDCVSTTIRKTVEVIIMSFRLDLLSNSIMKCEHQTLI